MFRRLRYLSEYMRLTLAISCLDKCWMPDHIYIGNGDNLGTSGDNLGTSGDNLRHMVTISEGGDNLGQVVTISDRW